MNILVTGGAGYVGGFTARHMQAAGHRVVVLDNLSEGHRSAAPEGALVVGEIADGDAVRALLREREIEAVMHFAASCYVGESMADPRGYWRNNVASSLALLEAMTDCRVRRIVFSSTCAVYGETAAMPLGEDAPVRPESTYAWTKHTIEQMIRDFSRAYGLSYTVLRYFNASGASADGAHGEDHRPETHLIPIVLQTLLGQRDEVRVYGADYDTPDGTCIRDYVHVEDLAQAHERALERLPAEGEPRGLLYNLGSGTGSSVREVIQAAERVTGQPVPCSVAERRPGDTPRLVAASGGARRELGWSPRYETIDEVVAAAWEWHRLHPTGYAD
jgi:UDP-glucose 4-epimerase